MAKWLEKLFKSNKKQEEIVSEEVIVENKPAKITNLTQYRLELDKGTTDFDFSVYLQYLIHTVVIIF